MLRGIRNKIQKKHSIPSAEWMLNNFQLQPSVSDNSKNILRQDHQLKLPERDLLHISFSNNNTTSHAFSSLFPYYLNLQLELLPSPLNTLVT